MLWPRARRRWFLPWRDLTLVLCLGRFVTIESTDQPGRHSGAQLQNLCISLFLHSGNCFHLCQKFLSHHTRCIWPIAPSTFDVGFSTSPWSEDPVQRQIAIIRRLAMDTAAIRTQEVEAVAELMRATHVKHHRQGLRRPAGPSAPCLLDRRHGN
jgi:hypothetical protein